MSEISASNSTSSSSPNAKKRKGILKQSSSFDRQGAGNRKSAKFDELNVLQTYHPPDKDYGHMKVEEPKTPYNYVENSDVDQLDAELLAEKLKVAAAESSSSEEEEPETEEQRAKRVEFEKRRKMHYNEFQAVKLARKLLEDELAELDEENADSKNSEKPVTTDSSQKMDVDKDEKAKADN
uniref:CSON013737 protein n=1 Tax=Culicoides sonorensis TaxID=179676 RepID=A0A336M8R1_CULSO